MICRFDKSREKFAFYKRVGVRELLLVDRHPWSLELHRADPSDWTLVGRSDLESSPSPVFSSVLGVTFQLIPGSARPQIEIVRNSPPKTWQI